MCHAVIIIMISCIKYLVNIYLSSGCRLIINMATHILIAGGATALNMDMFTRLTVLGGGVPVWERNAELGFQDQGRPRVSVLLKVDPEGLKGARFVATGEVNIDIKAKEIWAKASHSAYK